MNYKIINNHIELENGKPRGCKKITMTRLGAVLGINPWKTPFQAWCEIVKIYQPPFEENEATLAGKAIEPLVRKYLKEEVYESDNILSPEEYYGNSFETIYKKKDFYQSKKIFGGMWDTVLTKPNKIDIKRVFEQKTTKRSEDWVNDTPMYYLIQGLGYAYMSKLENLTMTVTFLTDEDYYHPESFVPTADNTLLRDYKASEPNVLLTDGNYYTIEQCFAKATEWWEMYVETGVSPDFDEVKDAEVLKALRKENLVVADDSVLPYLVEEYSTLNDEINEKSKRLKELKEIITEKLKSELDKDATLKQVVVGRATLTKSVSTRLDTQKIKDDGLYDKYAVTSESYRLTIKKEK